MLEVGCGHEGGVAPALGGRRLRRARDRPDARRRVRSTGGSRSRSSTIPGPFDAVVAGRVLHHVDPLGAALDKLAGLAPLLVLDEFAWNHMDEPTIDWYESQHRLLVAAGGDPQGPPTSGGVARAASPTFIPYETLRARSTRVTRSVTSSGARTSISGCEGPATESLEAGLIAAGAIRPIGFRYAGVSERDGALAGGLAVVGAELLLEHAGQLAARSQLLGDVGAADQLALDEDLRDRRPAGDLRQLLADRRVGEDVDARRPARRPRAARAARGRSCRT